MPQEKTVTTDGILLMLCESLSQVLASATNSDINYSPMIQKINKTCLKPDIGCFVLFDGGFSGLVVINFTADAALEIYQNYMTNMGMPSAELAVRHTSDEVGNVLGELMNQIVGDFTGRVAQDLLTSITQNQPKMLAINKEVIISINTNLDRPQARRVTFRTARHNIFYLELAIDKTEFIQLHSFEKQAAVNPDEIIDQAGKPAPSTVAVAAGTEQIDEDLLKELGL